MRRVLLERIAIGLSLVILGGWTIFWIVQIQDVLELLELAYG